MTKKEYIERGAALNELKEELGINTPMCTEEQNHYIDLGLKIAIKDIERLPAADAVDVVEIVRCKDCKYSSFVSYCSKYECGRIEDVLFFCNDFCSYGKRKED